MYSKRAQIFFRFKQKALICRKKQVVARMKSSVARENFAIPVGNDLSLKNYLHL